MAAAPAMPVLTGIMGRAGPGSTSSSGSSSSMLRSRPKPHGKRTSGAAGNQQGKPRTPSPAMPEAPKTKSFHGLSVPLQPGQEPPNQLVADNLAHGVPPHVDTSKQAVPARVGYVTGLTSFGKAVLAKLEPISEFLPSAMPRSNHTVKSIAVPPLAPPPPPTHTMPIAGAPPPPCPAGPSAARFLDDKSRSGRGDDGDGPVSGHKAMPFMGSESGSDMNELLQTALDQEFYAKPALAHATAENEILQRHLAREMEIANKTSLRLVHAEREAVTFHKASTEIWEESSQWSDQRAESAAMHYQQLANTHYQSFRVKEEQLMADRQRDLERMQMQNATDMANATATIRVLRQQNQMLHDEISAASAQLAKNRTWYANLESSSNYESYEASEARSALQEHAEVRSQLGELQQVMAYEVAQARAEMKLAETQASLLVREMNDQKLMMASISLKGESSEEAWVVQAEHLQHEVTSMESQLDLVSDQYHTLYEEYTSEAHQSQMESADRDHATELHAEEQNKTKNLVESLEARTATVDQLETTIAAMDTIIRNEESEVGKYEMQCQMKSTEVRDLSARLRQFTEIQRRAMPSDITSGTFDMSQDTNMLQGVSPSSMVPGSGIAQGMGNLPNRCWVPNPNASMPTSYAPTPGSFTAPLGASPNQYPPLPSPPAKVPPPTAAMPLSGGSATTTLLVNQSGGGGGNPGKGPGGGGGGGNNPFNYHSTNPFSFGGGGRWWGGLGVG